MSATTCRDCKHYNEGDQDWIGYCSIELPKWLGELLTTDQWSASRTVRANDQCDLGEEQ
jgi:hypothetical protein